MTYQRVVNRNRLNGGNDYDAPVDTEWHASGAATTMTDPVLVSLVEAWKAAADRFNQRVTTLMGDLRRFEKDALDEDVVCQAISVELEVHPDVVAAVIKEFLRR